MFKKLKPLIYSRLFIFLAYYIIRIYSKTFRLTVENEDNFRTLRQDGIPVLLCTWHQQFFSAIRHFKTYAGLNPALMISQSKDGDLISGVARRTGWHTPRGSSSNGGKHALDQMIHHLKTYGFGAHILDGPTGPMGKVKPGVIKMAREADLTVVPLSTRADRAWYFNSWDRFMLPKPFSRVWITFGQGLNFDADDEDFESQRRSLETAMQPCLILNPAGQAGRG